MVSSHCGRTADLVLFSHNLWSIVYGKSCIFLCWKFNFALNVHINFHINKPAVLELREKFKEDVTKSTMVLIIFLTIL